MHREPQTKNGTFDDRTHGLDAACWVLRGK